MNKNILLSLLIFSVAQIMVWLQLNGQFIWPLFKKYEWVLILTGMPITYLFLEATRQGVEGFDGLLWPQRFLAFACGIIIFAFLTWWLKGEGISHKTLVSLFLCVTLLSIQIFWK